MTKDEALRMALEGAANYIDTLGGDSRKYREVLAQPEQDHTYGYAKGLAEAIFKQHFASDEHYASGRIVWGVNDTVIGILTQIDNMVADMVRRPQQPERKPWVGLTEHEIYDALDASKVTELPDGYQSVDLEIARAIEAKLREKNA